MPNDPQYTDPNPGISRRLILDTTLNDAASRNGINQIRGLDSKGSLGSGIPKHVTNVGASVAQAATGTTSTVRVTFHRDPSDKNYSAAGVWVKGYQGNNNPVQVAQSYESPATFVLNNTGEPVSILVQSVGNGGQAPLSSAPTTGITLPKSTVAGYGTGTAVAYTPASPPPTPTNVPGTALDGQTLLYSEATAAWLASRPVSLLNSWGARANASANAFFAIGTSALTNGTVGTAFPTATAPQTSTFNTGTTASTSTGWQVPNTANLFFSVGTISHVRWQMKLTQTTNCRVWMGISDTPTLSVLRSDTPSFKFIGFRYSTTASDTVYKLVTSNGVSTTLTNESGSHVDTNWHTFEIHLRGTTAYFYIDNALVGSQSATYPAAGTKVFAICLLDNVALTNDQQFSTTYISGLNTDAV